MERFAKEGGWKESRLHCLVDQQLITTGSALMPLLNHKQMHDRALSIGPWHILIIMADFV